ncbi:hypothetical protein Q9189_007980 [Teloschistes chrysophthalmus]
MVTPPSQVMITLAPQQKAALAVQKITPIPVIKPCFNVATMLISTAATTTATKTMQIVRLHRCGWLRRSQPRREPTIALSPNQCSNRVVGGYFHRTELSNVVAGASTSTSTSSTLPPPSPKTTTVVQSSTQSNQNGQTSVVLLTSVITTGAAAPRVTSPAAATDTTSTPSKSSNAAAIGGGVGGGAAALLLLSALILFLVRRRRRRKERELDEATMHRPQGYLADQKDMDYMYKGQNGNGGTPYTGTTVAAGVEDSPELDGTEVMRKPSGRDYRPGDATRAETKVADTGRNGLGLGPQNHRDENRLSELVGSSPTTGQQRTYPAQGKWERYEQAGQGRV